MQISLMYELCEKIKIKHAPLLCMHFNYDICVYKSVSKTTLKIIKNYYAVKYTQECPYSDRVFRKISEINENTDKFK